PYHSINAHVKHVYDKEHSKETINYLRGLSPLMTSGMTDRHVPFIRQKLSNGGSAAVNAGRKMVSFSPRSKRRGGGNEEEE
ncbi:hypothetical protein PFISCL1PPCAC_9710, partial [Pristionchus fissidentatus]